MLYYILLIYTTHIPITQKSIFSMVLSDLLLQDFSIIRVSACKGLHILKTQVIPEINSHSNHHLVSETYSSNYININEHLKGLQSTSNVVRKIHHPPPPHIVSYPGHNGTHCQAITIQSLSVLVFILFVFRHIIIRDSSDS